MFDYLANPTRFMQLSNRLFGPVCIITVICLAYGLYLGLFSSPADYQQGDTVRIIYIHVPAAWLACSDMLGLGYAVCFILYGAILWQILPHAP